eukprot:4752875-Amphidinium_carterae.1
MKSWCCNGFVPCFLCVPSLRAVTKQQQQQSQRINRKKTKWHHSVLVSRVSMVWTPWDTEKLLTFVTLVEEAACQGGGNPQKNSAERWETLTKSCTQ